MTKQLIRVPSANGIKLDAVRQAAIGVLTPHGMQFEVVGHPTELQDRADLIVDAEPLGKERTLLYARMRWQEMCRRHRRPGDDTVDISIESGAMNGNDVAVVVFHTARGRELVVMSRGVPFPAGTLEEAMRRGVHRTTVGDVIHERWPHIPANDWQEHFPPRISRRQQISETVE